MSASTGGNKSIHSAVILSTNLSALYFSVVLFITAVKIILTEESFLRCSTVDIKYIVVPRRVLCSVYYPPRYQQTASRQHSSIAAKMRTHSAARMWR